MTAIPKAPKFQRGTWINTSLKGLTITYALLLLSTVGTMIKQERHLSPDRSQKESWLAASHMGTAVKLGKKLQLSLLP